MDFFESINKLRDKASSIDNMSLEELILLRNSAYDILTEYDNLQLVIKANCNSLYGSFGNQYFPLTDCDIAEDICNIGKHTAIEVDIAINKFFQNWASDSINLLKIQTFYPDVTHLKNNNYIKDGETDICVYGDTDSRYVDIGIVYDLIGKQLPPNNDEGNKELINFSIFLNKEFITDIIKTTIDNDVEYHNGEKGHLEMAHEIVSRDSVFLKKKHYIMSIIWKDEKIISPIQLKYMGVSIKRGETTPELKKIIIKLITKYLVDGVSIDYIKNECRKLKRYIIQKGNKSIVCRSTSVSGLSEFTFEDGKWIHPKNHIQIQIVRNWLNFLVENNLDKEYKNAFEGQKMYYYKTLNNKYPVIGVPDDVDVDKVPGLPLIDWDKMINGQFIKPLMKCLIPGKDDVDDEDCDNFLSTTKITNIFDF